MLFHCLLESALNMHQPTVEILDGSERLIGLRASNIQNSISGFGVYNK